ncbi:MAG: LamG domain-containing protein [bacterium]|nr:LamG domain-containing protein [bacterium]
MILAPSLLTVRCVGIAAALLLALATWCHASSSLDLSASTAYATTPDAAVFDFPGSFTIELRFQSNAPHDGVLVGKFWQNSGSPLDDSYLLSVRAADTVFARIQTTLQLLDLRAGGPIHDGAWHHVALVYDTANHVAELYLDGELKTSQTLNGTLRNTTEGVRLGAVLDGGSLSTFFNGRLDELRFWNTARRGRQAWCLKDVTLLTGTPGLVSYYRFDEGGGNLAADLVAPYENFNVTSGAAFSSQEPPLRSRLSGGGQCRCGDVGGTFSDASPPMTLVGDTVRVPAGDSLVLLSHTLTVDSTVSVVMVEGDFRAEGTELLPTRLLAQGAPAAQGMIQLLGNTPVSLEHTHVSGFANGALQVTPPLTLEHCRVSENSGCAITSAANMTILGSEFEGNGLALRSDGGDVSIHGSRFLGGGVEIANGNLDVDSAEFVGITKPGGGAAIHVGLSDLTRAKIFHCAFLNNTTGGAGGAIAAVGALSAGGSGDSLVVRDCIFQSNSADSGGAVCARNVNLLLEACAFDSNFAFSLGGALMAEATAGDVCRVQGDSLEFTHNTGGAVLLAGIPALSPVEARITNSTFAYNQRGASHQVPAFRAQAAKQIPGAGPLLERCLFHDNLNPGGAASAISLENAYDTGALELRNLTVVLNPSDSAAVKLSVPAMLRHSIVVENDGLRQIIGSASSVAYCLTSDTQYHGLGGSFYADPAFENFWERDFHLTAGSQAINRGDPNPVYNDPDGTRADVGAFVAENFSAEIESLLDVPHDNGRELMLEWLPSPGDNARPGIASYSIYRKVNLAVVENYELIATLPAAGLEGYGQIVPTLSDSNDTGTRYYAYFVRSQSVNPLAFWDTPLDSGYSVDNLSPAAPQRLAGLEVAGGAELTWDAVSDSDLYGYAIYRADTPFDPDTAAAIYAVSFTTLWVDSVESGTFYYAVRAVDRNGNRSAPSPVAAVDVGVITAPGAVTLAWDEGRFLLRWQASPGAVFYRIFRADYAGGPLEYIGMTTLTHYVLSDSAERAFYTVTANR